jgi:hypothetical protein
MYNKKTRLYECNICKKDYSSYQSLWIHNKKFHKDNNSKQSDTCINNTCIKDECIKVITNNKNYNCRLCNKIYNNKQSRWSHEKICKDRTNIIKENEKLKKENNELKYNHVVSTNNIINNNDNQINNQLIDLIIDKTKIIEGLKTKINDNSVDEVTIELSNLTLNNINIVSRIKDTYINVSQLCKAGNKNFNDWLCLDTTKLLFNDVNIVQLLDSKTNQDSWIHPDLAIQVAQWISPTFGLQVSKWIRTLFSNGPVLVDIKLLEDKEKEIKLKDQKIKLLENTYLKKHKRTNYLDNVIYIVTTKENKQNRIYIIGKAGSFKDRLSTYNKTAEHEVIYYQQCKSKESLNIIENMILKKLDKYRETANRDRFILPVDKNIDLFTKIVDNCINFIDNNEIEL